MSVFLEHAPCPQCGSRDNLGIYDDHHYCFGCGYYRRTIQHTDQNIRAPTKRSTGPILPSDCSRSLPAIAIEWLKAFDLTRHEIVTNNIYWSEEGIYLEKKDVRAPKLLVFPIYDNYQNLLLYQARSFSDDKGVPKWISRGNPGNVMHIMGRPLDNELVLVEDIVSAIKVSRVSRAMPLFGSHLSNENLMRIQSMVFPTPLIFWLDSDKLREAHKQSYRAGLIVGSSCVIYSLSDPKYYTTDEIKNKLDDRINQNAMQQ